MKRSVTLVLLIAAVLAALVTPMTWPSEADADETFTLRIASLAPRGSPWDRAFRAWNNTLKKQTGGKLQLQFYLGGSQGDERDFVRKMRAGQLDGAAVTTTGLGQVVRPVLVLATPGIFDTYAQIDRVRERLSGRLEGEFMTNGYKLLGWGDAGRARVFSNQPITKPEQLKTVKPWAWKDDAMFSEVMKVVNANPRRLGINEVLPALQTGRIDTFPASALAAVSLQWYNHATHVTKQTDSILLGATIIKKEKYEALPAELRAALDETSARAHAALSRSIRRADDNAYSAITRRGITEVDLTPNLPAWRAVGKKVRENLAGRLYPADLLAEVERIAKE